MNKFKGICQLLTIWCLLMGHVYLNPQGNGYAYVDNPTPSDGEQFTIYCIPDPGETLDDVRAFDSHDYPVAIITAQQIPMTFRDSWGSLYVDIYFSGSTPPTPSFPYWLLYKIRDGNNYVK